MDSVLQLIVNMLIHFVPCYLFEMWLQLLKDTKCKKSRELPTQVTYQKLIIGQMLSSETIFTGWIFLIKAVCV